MSDLPQYSVFKTVFMYCLFILVAPVATFFIVKSIIFEGVFGATSVSTSVWSAVAAVVVLHVALGLFIIKAYSGDTAKPSKDAKVD